MPGYILALDQGTTSSRAALVDAGGRLTAVASEPFPQHFPAPGLVEHDPEEIWQSQLTAARRVLAENNIQVAEIAAIGITNQRETTLLWERATGRPVHNAIVWQDRRTADRCAHLRAEGREADLRDRTGLVPDPYFSATKLEWLLNTVPGAREAATRGELAFGTVDTYLLWRLTGGRVHATDPSNASRTLLWNIHTRQWDPHLLDLFTVPSSLLPEVRATSGPFGETEPDLFGRPIPLLAVAGDQQAALFGQAAVRPGMVKNTYGTGCFLLVHTGDQPVPSQRGLLTTAAWRVGDRMEYALEGSVFVAGAAVQWLRDGLGLIGAAAETEELALSVPDSGGVYVVPAFTGLGAPYWDPQARGTIVGLTRGTSRAHLARATLESIALQTVDVVRCMEADYARPLAGMRVDGGASDNDFLMQTQADLLGLPVERARVRETTALGAAWLAGLAAGLWPSIDAVAQLWEADRVFEPQMSTDQHETILHGWRRAVDRARSWAE